MRYTLQKQMALSGSKLMVLCNAGRSGSAVHSGAACQGPHCPGQLGSPDPGQQPTEVGQMLLLLHSIIPSCTTSSQFSCSALHLLKLPKVLEKEHAVESAIPTRGRLGNSMLFHDMMQYICIERLTCRYVEAGLLWSTQDGAAVKRHVACMEDTHWLRNALPGLGLVAFVANGSILPRQASLHINAAA